MNANDELEQKNAVDVKQWREMAMGDSEFYRPEFLYTVRWGAVPVESAWHFDENDVRLISSAAMVLGERSMYAAPLEPYKGIPERRVFSTTPNGLSKFQEEYGPYDFLLLGEDRSFSVICTSDYYFVLAGPREFLERAAGLSTTAAIEKFQADSQVDGRTEREKELGRKLVKWCNGAVANMM